MPVDTVAHHRIEPARAGSVSPARQGVVGWKPRHLLSNFSDRRSLRTIGGMGAYVTQVRWSLWWALRRTPEPGSDG